VGRNQAQQAEPLAWEEVDPVEMIVDVLQEVAVLPAKTPAQLARIADRQAMNAHFVMAPSAFPQHGDTFVAFSRMNDSSAFCAAVRVARQRAGSAVEIWGVEVTGTCGHLRFLHWRISADKAPAGDFSRLAM
jgi:hypothetical protein